MIMEPNHNEIPNGSELPHLEQATSGTPNHEQLAPLPEIRGQQAPVMTQASSSATPPVSVASLIANADGSNSVPVTTNASNSVLTADDADLIEKEWVQKAKAIVMQTKDDPRAQNIQMNGVKAEYLKKRYNKDLKVSDV